MSKTQQEQIEDIASYLRQSKVLHLENLKKLESIKPLLEKVEFIFYSNKVAQKQELDFSVHNSIIFAGACFVSDLKFIKDLKPHVDQSALDNYPLILASIRGNLSILKELLRSLERYEPKHLEKALLMAATHEHSELFKELLRFDSPNPIDLSAIFPKLFMVVAKDTNIDILIESLLWRGKAGQKCNPSLENNILIKEASYSGNNQVVLTLLTYQAIFAPDRLDEMLIACDLIKTNSNQSWQQPKIPKEQKDKWRAQALENAKCFKQRLEFISSEVKDESVALRLAFTIVSLDPEPTVSNPKAQGYLDGYCIIS